METGCGHLSVGGEGLVESVREVGSRTGFAVVGCVTDVEGLRQEVVVHGHV